MGKETESTKGQLKFKDVLHVLNAVEVEAINGDTVLNGKLKKFKESCDLVLSDFATRRHYIELECAHAYADGEKKGCLMRDEKGGLMFTVDGEKKKMEGFEKILNSPSGLYLDQIEGQVLTFIKKTLPYILDK